MGIEPIQNCFAGSRLQSSKLNGHRVQIGASKPQELPPDHSGIIPQRKAEDSNPQALPCPWLATKVADLRPYFPATGALPLSYTRITIQAAGFEPATSGLVVAGRFELPR